MKKIYFLIFAFGYLAMFMNVIGYKSGFPAFQKTLLLSTSSRYIITSEEFEDYGKYLIYYPPVSVRPDSFKYIFVNLYEQYQLLTNQQTRLFFASKRINELVTWINVLHTKNGINSFSQFEAQIKGKKDGSFESVLSVYAMLVDHELQSLKEITDESVKKNRTYELKKNIFQHKNRLENAIKDASISERRKKYLFSLIQVVFNSYYKYINLTGAAASPNTYIYSLNPIEKNYDYGYYNVYIDQQDIPPLSSANSFLLDGGAKYYLQRNADHPYQFIFPNVAITPGTHEVKAILPEYTYHFPSWNTSLAAIMPFTNKSGSDYFKYTTDLSNTIPYGTMQILFLYILPKGSYISLDVYSADSQMNHIFDYEVTSDLEGKVEGQSITKNNTADRYILSIFSKKQLGKESLSLFSEHITRQEKPKLIFEKKMPLSNPTLTVSRHGKSMVLLSHNISAEQKNLLINSISEDFSLVSESRSSTDGLTLIFESNTFIFLKRLLVVSSGLLLLFILTLAFKPIMNKKHLYYEQYLNYSHQFIVTTKLFLDPFNKYIQKMYKAVLIIFGFLIFLDIVFINRIFDPLTICLILLLYIVSVITKKSKLFYFSAILTMISAICLFMLNLEFPMRKAADWTYILLLAGVVKDILTEFL